MWLGPVGQPRLAPRAAALGGLGLERLLVGVQLALGHPVRLAALDEEAALAELRLDVGLDAAGLHDGAPEGDRGRSLPLRGHRADRAHHRNPVVASRNPRAVQVGDRAR